MAIAAYRNAMREAGSWASLRREFGMRLPVLLYHHVGPKGTRAHPELTVSPQRFERQVRWLAMRGYTGITAADWLRWVRQGKPLPPKPILLTFDDGYADLGEHALPVLRRYGFSAVVYIITGKIGGKVAWEEPRDGESYTLMTAEQIRHWAREGIEFGAHSRTHRIWRHLAQRNAKRRSLAVRTNWSGSRGASAFLRLSVRIPQRDGQRICSQWLRSGDELRRGVERPLDRRLPVEANHGAAP